MAPRATRKRPAASDEAPPSKRRKADTRDKTSIFAAVDAETSKASTAAQTREYINGLQDTDSGSEDSDDDHEFEDVPGMSAADDSLVTVQDGEGSDDGDEDGMDWEDAGDTSHMTAATNFDDSSIGDVTVTLNDNIKHGTATDRAASTLKKGPSKRERQVRNGTHCIHVQSLMWHNTIRNSWLNDKELHKILVDGLPEGIRIEVDKWRANMGMPKLSDDSQQAMKKTARMKRGAAKNKSKRGGRDWDLEAERQEKGAVNISQGDPTLKMLKVLTAYWRKRFMVTIPGIRKLGYMPLKRLTQEINAWKKDRTNEKHGERLENLQHFKAAAKRLEGSRDVGSQLFTAMVRALGLETRMVANLQPAGIGWGKVEEARPVKDGKQSNGVIDVDSDSDDSTDAKPKTKSAKAKAGGKKAQKSVSEKPSRPSKRTSNSKVISLDSDESSLSSAPSDLEDDASIVDVTESFTPRRPKKKYDRDMHYPNYWTEVLSPATNTFIPVDPIILSTVATNGELLSSFEPRGKRADQAKQVICYTIAHSSDGSAKDVTVRYLKKHQLPGRTKGYRMPVEKIKVYNRKGKVRRYEEYDWFKTVMSVFERPSHLRTAADDLEEATDLRPLQSDITKPGPETESLQWYKQSAEFVLEKHLRREEALLPTAKPVRDFTSGKGDKTTTDPVFLRKDIVPCKTAESWHKEGREIRLGEQPMKLVPMRAVTTMRKREMEDIERETGEKAKQGLFARSQTEWIIPPPIGPDREIPRNAFGNIDVYVPSMVPKGAVHLPLKGAARVCRDLQISHAEAVTGFEFGKRMAIPVITGVVVPEEEEERVRELWEEREAVKRQKEAAKKSQACLALWRKLFTGLRIMERMRKEYAGTGREEDINPFVRKAKKEVVDLVKDEDVQMAEPEVEEEGGFVREEHDRRRNLQPIEEVKDEIEDMQIEVEGGGFFLDTDGIKQDEEKSVAADTPVKPISLRAAKGQLNGFRYDEDAEADDIKSEGTSTAASAANHLMNGKMKEKESSPITDAEDDMDDAPVPIKKTPVTKTRQSRKSTTSTQTSTAKKRTPRSSAKKRTSPTKSQYFSSPTATTTKRQGGRRRQAVVESEEDGEAAEEDEEMDDARSDDGTHEHEIYDDDGVESEEEVVKPRMTTARTRTRDGRK